MLFDLGILNNSCIPSINYLDTKTGEKHYNKRKLQANISDEHRCKNPQQNISKPNSTIH